MGEIKGRVAAQRLCVKCRGAKVVPVAKAEILRCPCCGNGLTLSGRGAYTTTCDKCKGSGLAPDEITSVVMISRDFIDQEETTRKVMQKHELQ